MKNYRISTYDRDLENLVRQTISLMRDEGLVINFDNFTESYRRYGGIINLDALRIFDRRAQRDSYYICSPEIVSFIGKFISFIQPRNVLDPCCGTGSFFVGIDCLLKRKARYFGIDIDQSILNQAKNYLDLNKINYKLKNVDFLEIKENINQKFDLIISQPPFGRLESRIDINDMRVNRIEVAILLSCLDLLEDNGYLIFIMPENWIDIPIYTYLKEYLLNNYSIESIISLPESQRAIRTSLFVLKKALQKEKVFFGAYNEKNEDILINNYILEESNEKISDGYWIDSNQLLENVTWNINFFKAIEEIKTIEHNSKYSFKKLAELTERVRESDDNTILLPRMNSHEIILRPELDDEDRIRRNHYIQLQVTDHEISPQYLKIYLNSRMGKKQRNLFSYGRSMFHLDQRGLEHIIIEIPDLNVQKEIINADQKLSEINNEFETLKNRFNDKIFNYTEILKAVDEFMVEDDDFAYEDLIWPLATSYRLAVKGSSNITERAMNYFNLFEMVPAFNSIVLLSALPNDIYSDQLNYIWDLNNNNFSRVSMGTWIGLYSRLSKIYRSIDNDYFDFMPFDKSFYEKISSKRLLNIMNRIPKMRSDRAAHAGNMDEIDAEDTVDELNPYLTYVFGILKTYQPLDLIYPTHFKKKKDLYKIMAKKLEGAYSSFATEEFYSKSDMDTDVLYLYNSINDNRLLLNSNLIKLIKCRVCGNWSVYIYDKIIDNKAVYKSYQVELHPYEEKVESLEELLELN